VRRCGLSAALAVIGGALGLALGVGSCSTDPSRGYSLSSAHSSSIRTVAVPVFKNITYSQSLEVELTEALISEMRRTTRWKVTSSDSADAVLTGKITESEMRTLSIGRDTGLVEQVAIRVTVDFDFTDTRTGRPVVSRRRFSGMSSFVPARPAAERIETGEHDVVQELARDIVAELRSEW
jgi:hypothetical protein